MAENCASRSRCAFCSSSSCWKRARCRSARAFSVSENCDVVPLPTLPVLDCMDDMDDVSDEFMPGRRAPTEGRFGSVVVECAGGGGGGMFDAGCCCCCCCVDFSCDIAMVGIVLAAVGGGTVAVWLRAG